MKRAEKVFAVSAGILLFLSAGAWAHPVPAAARSATGQKSVSAKKKKAEKTKKWHGKLVDATCMSKAMHIVSASALHGSAEGAPSVSSGSSQSQFVSYSSAPRQAGQSGSEHQIEAVPPRPGEPATFSRFSPVGARISNVPSLNYAELEKGAMLEHAAKQLTATSTTSQFGLVTDSGAVVKFGKSGNSKASEAVKQVELKPKKPVEATVRGLEISKGGFLVTSVEVKGGHKK